MTDMFYENDIEGKRILLHACCGPCALGAIEPLLEEGADITLFYYNPCIIDGEFEKRYEALQTVAENYKLPVVALKHDYGVYKNTVGFRGDEKEGGARCALCIGERLKTSAIYARDNGFDAYSTTLTVSPHKDSKRIFALAEAFFEGGIGAPFLKRDFKKRDGFLRSCRLSEKLGIYRQRFCGCEYSAVSAGIDVKNLIALASSEYSTEKDLADR